jgi:hypothetical protein
MSAVLSRTACALGAILLSLAGSANAQYYDPCGCVVAPTVQAIPQTVYREMPVTKYRQVEKTVEVPVLKTEYEDRPVTAYRPVTETRVAEIPSVTYQNITEQRQVTVNRSYWQTNWQPVVKMHPLQYDPSPTLIGELNRIGYATRMAFTPNYIPQSQYVPNMVAYNVPVTRTVAVPTSRQVTYNVTKMEPYQTTQRVAVQKVHRVARQVTAYEPYTVTETVAVGTTMQYALVPPAGSVTAASPTPARTAEGETIPQRRAEDNNSGGGTQARPLSYPRPKPQPRANPTYHDARTQPADEAGAGLAQSAASTPTVVRVAGWRPHRSQTAAKGPALRVASN